MLRVAYVSYLNSIPLARDLAGDERLDVVPMPPADVASELLSGRADIGLVPVAALIGRDDLTWLPGLGIAADGPVDSVFVYHRGDPARRVALDPHSRTSQALTRLLAVDGVLPVAGDASWMERDPREAFANGEDDAVLVIGDLALELDPGPEWTRVDLAEAWLDHTGLPFVFAVWGLSADLAAREPWLEGRFTAALDAGVADLDGIAAEHAAITAGDPARAARYLRENIVFRLGEREEAGLRLFLERAQSIESSGR